MAGRLLFVVLQTIDMICTAWLLTPETEANILAKYLWENYTIWSLVLMKIFVVVGFLCLFPFLKERHKTPVIITINMLSSIPVIMFGVLLWILANI